MNEMTDEPKASSEPIESPESTTPTDPSPLPTPTATQRPRRTTAIAAALVVGLVAGSLAGGAAGGLVGAALHSEAPAAATATTSSSTVLTAASGSTADVSSVVAGVVDAVVTIDVSVQSRGGLTASGSGSGFIVSSDGLILTSYHVIDGASQISVVMGDGSTQVATVVASDASRDVALLDIPGSNLPTVTLSSADVQVGQGVISIGTALGEYPNTVTTGIVSGLNRSMTASTGFRTSETLTDVIQTDAALSSGMSGGPLLDMAGRVVGINTAVYGDANGIGFAVPIADGLALLSSSGAA